MMRKTLATGTFLALGMAAVGVGAVDNVAEKGSDTLKAITLDLLSSAGDGEFCAAASADGVPGAPGLDYIGTGSGAGELALLAAGPAQAIAPMSRVLNRNSAAICGFSEVADAEGIVFALDGLSIIGSVANTAACDTGVDDCDKTTAPTRGLAFSKTITVADLNGVAGIQCDQCVGTNFTFHSWRELIRVLYTGMENTDAAVRANRDCNSDLRHSIRANWENLFENACGAQGCATGLKHAFRRDEESGTTDVFLSLLQLPGVSFTASATALPTETGESNNVAQSAFCNVRHPEDAWGAVKGNRTVGGVVSPAVNIPPLKAGRNVLITAPYWPEYQDEDPVRIATTGTGTGSTTPNAPTEQVSGADSKLGLVLPITIPPIAVTNLAAAYPTQQCTPGRFVIGKAPPVNSFSGTNCPNGDPPIAGTKCLWPSHDPDPNVLGDENCACLNGRGSSVFAHLPTLVLDPTLAKAEDGRIYNLHLGEKIPDAGDEVVCRYRTQPRPQQGSSTGGSIQASIVGAFYRIHSSRTLNAAPSTANTCKELTSSIQLGCLTQASPCAVSFAGREGADFLGTARSISINALPPTDQCVQNVVAIPAVPNNTYDFSRRLYVNTLRGFEDASATGQEFGLAKCFATISNATVIEHGFVPMPVARPPFCSDFKQNLCSGAPVNTDACQNNTGAADLGIAADDPELP